MSKVQISDKLEKLIKAVEELTVLELSELVKALEEKFGVSAAAPAAAAASVNNQESGGEPKEEKTNFNVILKNPGDKKIQVIKALREIKQDLGLTDAKKIVDNSAADPQTLLENAKKEDAEEAKKKLETAGATVELT